MQPPKLSSLLHHFDMFFQTATVTTSGESSPSSEITFNIFWTDCTPQEFRPGADVIKLFTAVSYEFL
jgi:hypothetical protein